MAAATRATNRVLWNRYVLPRLGSYQMVVLAHQPEIVQEFKAELVADGVGDPTIKRTLTVLSAVLGKAVEWNRIPSNPVATVRKPSGRRSKPVCTLVPEVVERLRVVMPSERDRRLVSVLAYSGLRPGEALALESTDVGKKTISVARAIKLDGPGDTKTHKARSIGSHSTAGTFTATHDPEGKLLTAAYPNGMTTAYTYNQVGWLSQVVEKLPDGECKTIKRRYTYEGEGDRTSYTTTPPNSDNTCGKQSVVTTHAYDTGDALIDGGVEYEPLGNITKLPAVDASGAEGGESTELDSSYYVDSQLGTQTQDGRTLHYTYDPEGRLRGVAPVQVQWSKAEGGRVL